MIDFSAWDDLVHGTLVFSALIPFLLGLVLALKLPLRFFWVVAVAVLLPVSVWLFGFPKLPPQGSDEIVMVGLIAALVLLSIELALGARCSLGLRIGLRTIVFAGIGWSVYPAWLSADGGTGRLLLVVLGFALSISVGSTIVENLSNRDARQRFSQSPAVFIPPVIALAVLLQTGGSMQFAQVAGALAAGLTAMSLVSGLKRKQVADEPVSQGRTAAFCVMLFLMLAWSGWLYAEIRWGLALLLLLAPTVALLLQLIPTLPRGTPFRCMLWDVVGAALVALPVAAWAVIEFMAEMSEYEGY